MRYSIIVPVYNRPDEVNELLESLTRQEEKDFEVVIVEDGSKTPCQKVCDQYAGRLDLHYFMKPNSGPGQSRNYGAERAKGDYLLILDSDVVLPEGYLTAISKELDREPADAFGGPDCAHSSFTPTQKAISYSMTSFFTTGGIRGGKKKLDKFYPDRSTWAYGARPTNNWEASQRCDSAKISTSPSVSSRRDCTAACFPRRGYGTNDAPTSVSSGDRFSTAELHESISTRNIPTL